MKRIVADVILIISKLPIVWQYIKYIIMAGLLSCLTSLFSFAIMDE
jgi:hypothetical protein